jgi:ribokinase
VRSAREVLGGTAANIARSAAGWGVAAGVLSLVGEDFPPRFVEELRRSRVDVRGLLRVPGARSPYCVIVEDGAGGQFTLIDQAAMHDGVRGPVPNELLRGCRWVHLTTGPTAYQLRVGREARRRGVHVAVDPAQEVHYRWDRRGIETLLAGAEVLFGNRAEIDRVLALLRLRRREELLARVPLVVETRAGRGAIGWTRSRVVRVPAAKHRRLRQVTGAGDAFRGGFYSGWFSGQPIEDCLRAGTRSAARWIEAGGAPSGPPGPGARP